MNLNPPFTNAPLVRLGHEKAFIEIDFPPVPAPTLAIRSNCDRIDALFADFPALHSLSYTLHADLTDAGQPPLVVFDDRDIYRLLAITDAKGWSQQGISAVRVHGGVRLLVRDFGRAGQ